MGIEMFMGIEMVTAMSEASSGESREFALGADSEGMRYDQVLARELGLSRSALEPLFEMGAITYRESGRAIKKSDRVGAGDLVQVHFPPTEEIDEEHVITKERATAFLPASHVIIELEYVMMHKKGITFLNRSIIFIGNLFHYSIAVRELMVLFRSIYN